MMPHSSTLIHSSSPWWSAWSCELLIWLATIPKIDRVFMHYSAMANKINNNTNTRHAQTYTHTHEMAQAKNFEHARTSKQHTSGDTTRKLLQCSGGRQARGGEGEQGVVVHLMSFGRWVLGFRASGIEPRALGVELCSLIN